MLENGHSSLGSKNTCQAEKLPANRCNACDLQMIIILFAPSFTAANATLTFELRGNASAIGREAWKATGDSNMPAWETNLEATQIRVMVDYSLHSAVKVNETLPTDAPQL